MKNILKTLILIISLFSLLGACSKTHTKEYWETHLDEASKKNDWCLENPLKAESDEDCMLVSGVLASHPTRWGN